MRWITSFDRDLTAIGLRCAASDFCVVAARQWASPCSPATSSCSRTRRSTRGENRLVSFGGYPLEIPQTLIDTLQQRTQPEPQPLLQPGDRVRIVDGSFAELEAIFLCMDGEERVVLLMKLLNREQKLTLPLASVRRG